MHIREASGAHRVRFFLSFYVAYGAQHYRRSCVALCSYKVPHHLVDFTFEFQLQFT
jgi:hypothetical protein